MITSLHPLESLCVQRARPTRRGVLGLAIGAAVGGALARVPGMSAFVAAADAPQTSAPVTFPKGAIIRTLFEDLRPETLAGGATLMHEHLNLPSTAPPDQVVEMVKAARLHGVRGIVDAGHTDMKRSVDALRDISRRTGVPVVGCAGYHYERFYPPEIATQSEDQIAEALIAEVRANHLGAFGEMAESDNKPMTDLERKMFRAVGTAHVRTGLPIITHTASGTGPNVPENAGLRQLDLLESVGVDPKHVVIGHMCCHDEPSIATIKALAKRGAFVGFDRVTGGLVPDEKKPRMVVAFLDAGYADRLLLSSDFTGHRSTTGARSAFEVPSDQLDYGITLTVFLPKLRAAGVNDTLLRTITSDNPRRFLAFVPKGSVRVAR